MFALVLQVLWVSKSMMFPGFLRVSHRLLAGLQGFPGFLACPVLRSTETRRIPQKILRTPAKRTGTCERTGKLQRSPVGATAFILGKAPPIRMRDAVSELTISFWPEPHKTATSETCAGLSDGKLRWDLQIYFWKTFLCLS